MLDDGDAWQNTSRAAELSFLPEVVLKYFPPIKALHYFKITFKSISIEINVPLDDNERSTIYMHFHTLHILFINGFKLHFYCTILSSQQVVIHSHSWMAWHYDDHYFTLLDNNNRNKTLNFSLIHRTHTLFCWCCCKLLLNKMNIKFKAFLSCVLVHLWRKLWSHP